jgi:hypothetical protein
MWRGLMMCQRKQFRAAGEPGTIRRGFTVVVQMIVLLAWSGYFGQRPAAAASLEPELVCRAAIGSVMSRDPKLFRVTRTDSSVLLLSYVRRLDNFVWTYRCKIEGDRVIWASEPGRWRDGPKDDKVSFEMVAGGTQLRIVYDRRGRSLTKLVDLDKLR